MIKTVLEISDLLFKTFGAAIIENFARGIYQGTWVDKIVDTFSMICYTCIHSSLLILEMFTLHVAISSSEESILNFLFYNNFSELKITVFKKVDIPGLY